MSRELPKWESRVREETETCSRCRRPGYVRRITPALQLSVDFVARDYKPEPAKNLPTGVEPAWCFAGCSISEAVSEGIGLAKAIGRPVGFQFNDRLVVCHAGDNPDTVVRAWWESAYGKTIEESWKDR